MIRTILLPVSIAAAISLAPPAVRAQGVPTAADSALAACSQAARQKDEATSKAQASRAESLFRAQLREAPESAAPRVGLARVISECRIGFANVLSAGRLIGESNELLTEALRRDPRSWAARFTLAMNHYHTPEFLGKTDDAIESFEALLAQQGERADVPFFALPYAYLGDLYRRTGRRADAMTLWRRGAALFPESTELRERLAAAEPRGEEPAPLQLSGVMVRMRRATPESTRAATSMDRMEVVTAPGGAADLMQALKMQGAVTQVNDGSDLFVRGGEPAEAPVWVDGGRVTYPGTFETLHGGLFGVLSPAVIREAVFFGGGFSARYGNALSGALDVTTEGRPSARRASAGIDISGGSATLGAPIGERGGAWVTGRVTDASILAWQQGTGEEFTASPRAMNATAGVVVEPRSGVEVKATALVQGDGATRWVESNGHSGDFRSRGGTRQLVVSAIAGRRGGRRAEAALSGSERATAFRFGVLDRERTDRSLSASLSFSAPVGGRSNLRTGVETMGISTVEEGWMPESDAVGPDAAASWTDERSDVGHLGGYLEIETDLTGSLSLVTGLRADRLPGEEVWTADPRAALAYRFPGWTARVGTGVFHQGRWRSGYLIPDPSAPAGLPRRARHLVMGVEQTSGDIRAEAYIKEYDRYVDDGRRGPRVVGGRVAGVDARVRWAAGERLSGWLAYSFLRGRLELEGGETVPSRVDVTNGVTAVGKWAIGDSWEWGATARYATGRPYTEVVGTSPGERGLQPAYGATHGDRLPRYMRLDTRLTRIGTIGSRRAVGYLELLNALDRRNMMGYTYDASYRERRSIDSFFANRVAVLGIDVQLR